MLIERNIDINKRMAKLNKNSIMYKRLKEIKDEYDLIFKR